MGGALVGRAVVGVDGHRGRWVVVRAKAGAALTAELIDDLGPLVDQVRRGDLGAMAIDMPIGLFDDRPRPCDIATRRVLGPRRASVFPAPVRATLAAVDYDDACRLSREACGKALSKQAFHLLGPIRQLDELLRPADADIIVEAHPECAFLRLAGEPLPSKHDAEGRARRIELLDAALGPSFVELRNRRRAGPRTGRTTVPLPDLLDAAALTITAGRVVDGSATRLGGEPDSTGKPAQVVY